MIWLTAKSLMAERVGLSAAALTGFKGIHIGPFI